MLAAWLAAGPVFAGSVLTQALMKPEVSHHSQHCDPPTFGRDKLTLVCALDEVDAMRVLQVKVHLTGSHDDTTASMEVTVSGAPVTCDTDSKTNTEGEEGDVTLDCKFTVAHKPGMAAVLQASAKWFHAQYVNHEVVKSLP